MGCRPVCSTGTSCRRGSSPIVERQLLNDAPAPNRHAHACRQACGAEQPRPACRDPSRRRRRTTAARRRDRAPRHRPACLRSSARLMRGAPPTEIERHRPDPRAAGVALPQQQARHAPAAARSRPPRAPERTGRRTRRRTRDRRTPRPARRGDPAAVYGRATAPSTGGCGTSEFLPQPPHVVVERHLVIRARAQRQVEAQPDHRAPVVVGDEWLSKFVGSLHAACSTNCASRLTSSALRYFRAGLRITESSALPDACQRSSSMSSKPGALHHERLVVAREPFGEPQLARWVRRVELERLERRAAACARRSSCERTRAPPC